jgi:hypothetical protein
VAELLQAFNDFAKNYFAFKNLCPLNNDMAINAGS